MVKHGCIGCKRFPPGELDAMGDRGFGFCRRIDRAGVRGRELSPLLSRDPGRGFLQVAKILGNLDLNVPMVLARDMERGFLLLSDLGSCQYLDALPAEGAADELYADALKSLRTMQTAAADLSQGLPRYD